MKARDVKKILRNIFNKLRTKVKLNKLLFDESKKVEPSMNRNDLEDNSNKAIENSRPNYYLSLTKLLLC